MEYRSINSSDIKIDKERRTITGIAVVYNAPSVVMRTSSGIPYKEIILAGALARSLKSNDLVAYREHKPEYLLGRLSANTLRATDTDAGLMVEIDIPKSSMGDDIITAVERGDLKNFSFAFNSPKQRMYKRNNENYVEISELDITEVSLVARPVYPQTSASLRSEDFVEENKETTTPKQVEFDAVKWKYKLLLNTYGHIPVPTNKTK